MRYCTWRTQAPRSTRVLVDPYMLSLLKAGRGGVLGAPQQKRTEETLKSAGLGSSATKTPGAHGRFRRAQGLEGFHGTPPQESPASSGLEGSTANTLHTSVFRLTAACQTVRCVQSVGLHVELL